MENTVSNLSTWILLLIGGASIIILSFVFKYISLWFQAFISGAKISLFNIIAISFRKIPPRLIVTAKITSFKAGLNISVSDLETHFLAGGKVNDVVRSMIAAKKAKIDLDWERSTAIDLAGRNIFEAVKTSVYPKVIDCPPQNAKESCISAVAKDGVELKCKARVTVRTDIKNLVGGATEETIIARVGEGIVSAIGSAKDHGEVLESPQRISELVLAKGLHKGTAFEILSIDILDVTIGENVGARLRAAEAETQMRVSRAEAEKRRAMAVALEQENSAQVKLEEAKIPQAMAEALSKGYLGVMDFKRLKNIDADTKMRGFIGAKKE